MSFMKCCAVGLSIALLAACGGSGTSSEAIATAAITNAVTGRYAAYYGQLAPEVQAATTREAFVKCMGKASDGIPGAKATVVESTRDASYTKADGTTISADSVTMRIEARGVTSTLVVWIANHKVAATDPQSDAHCIKRL